MSYVRKGPASDVYVFENISGMYTCCNCNLLEEANNFSNFDCKTIPEMIEHLGNHLHHFDEVPLYAFDSLVGDFVNSIIRNRGEKHE